MDFEKAKNDGNPFISDTGITDTLGKGWKVFRSVGGRLFVAGIVAGLASIPSSIANNLPIEEMDAGPAAFIGLFALVYSLFVSNPVSMGLSGVYARGARGDAFTSGEAYRVFNNNYWNTVGGPLLLGLIIAVPLIVVLIPFFIFVGASTGASPDGDGALLLFVVVFLIILIPLIYVQVRLSFVPQLLTDAELGAWQSIKSSWEMTNGYVGSILGVGFLGGLATIIGFFLLIVPGIIASLWVQASIGVMYNSIAARDGIPGLDKRKNEDVLSYQ